MYEQKKNYPYDTIVILEISIESNTI